MGTSRNSGPTTSLDELLAMADVDTLRDLVRQLYKNQPAAQRECLDFLRERLPIAGKQSREAAGEAVLLLWREAEPCLAGESWREHGQCGGLLDDLVERLRAERIPSRVRRSIVDEGLMHIGETDFEDDLYGVLYAASPSDEELRYLAGRLEEPGLDWPLEQARHIYRLLGDREKYLELRARKMVYGTDYYDLAMFYSEAGETDRALTVAKEGLLKGQGRLDDLRRFLANHALDTGDRETYLDLQFQQAIDGINVQSYQDFQRLCTDSEWVNYECRFVAALSHARPAEQLKIHLLRDESERAITILSSRPYSWWHDDSAILTAVASLEKRFPEQVLEFYREGVGDITSAHQRNHYAHTAKLLLKIRRVWVEIMGQAVAWEKFARNIKAINIRRPALQEEFGRIIPDWKSL